MNYRHAFHAGNFADVLKHAVLTRILVHLRSKPAPFRVLDIHAGASIAAPARALLAPYLDAVAACNREGRLTTYPGSPALVRTFLRLQDRLIACELEPSAAAALARHVAGDRCSKALTIDGWTALNAYVPPKERRGLVLVDPAYEDAGDFARLPATLAAAYRKWASGTYLVWYPIKDRTAPDALARRLRNSGIPKILRAELSITAREPGRLAACGLIAINPPWTLAAELAILLPELAAVLSAPAGGAHRLDWFARER